jgi:hypothetical protein
MKRCCGFAESRLWAIERWIRHPIENWYWHRKWRHRPKVGDKIQDCRYQIHTVVAFGDCEDDLVLDDGSSCSWMHCCDLIEEGR